MRYRLHDDLSYCRVDDRLIFFDVARDRYYQLPTAIEQTFVAYFEQADTTDVNVSDLVKRDVLVPASPGLESAQMQPPNLPTHSAAERLPDRGTLRLGTMLEVLSTILLTRWQLKNRALKEVLGSLIRSRSTARHPLLSGSSEASNVLLTETAGEFTNARRYVPVEPTCLLDSIALVRFLSKRNLTASLVFGVTGAPFSAHCWVQVENAVLNDTVGNVGSYTPIRVI